MSTSALLVVDTHGTACGALLRRPGFPDLIKAEQIGRGHDRRLAPLVQGLLSDVDVSPREIAKIAVCVGPGSFTGVRVGVAFARGFSLALGVPAVGVNVLDALGWSMRDEALAVAIHDAKRDEVVWCVYCHGEPVDEPRLQSVQEATLALADLAGTNANVRVAGSGVSLVTAAGFTDVGLPVPPLEMLTDRAETLSFADHPARPFHHRPPDALPSR